MDSKGKEKTMRGRSPSYRNHDLGKSDRPDSYFDKKQLKIGTKIELEHTDDYLIAKQIAKDHLEEHPNYYRELIKMEKKLEKQERQ